MIKIILQFKSSFLWEFGSGVSTIFYTLGMVRPRFKPTTSLSKSGRSTNWAIRAVEIAINVWKKANIRNRYNQVPHLTQNTECEWQKNKKTSITRKPRNRHHSMTKTKTNSKKDLQKKHRLGEVSMKIIVWSSYYKLQQIVLNNTWKIHIGALRWRPLTLRT